MIIKQIMQIDAVERITLINIVEQIDSMNAVERVGSINVVEPKGSRDYSIAKFLWGFFGMRFIHVKILMRKISNAYGD